MKKFFGIIAIAIGALSCTSQANANGCFTQWSVHRNGLVWNCGGHVRPYHGGRHGQPRPYVRPRIQYGMPAAPAYWQGGNSYRSSYRSEHHERRSYASRNSNEVGNPRRAEQQAMCEEQAAKRRARGVVDSHVQWVSPNTCIATGGYVEHNRL